MTATEQLTAYAERLERILDEIESLKDGLSTRSPPPKR
jgi:uncharacterized protein (UPF0335 family)